MSEPGSQSAHLPEPPFDWMKGWNSPLKNAGSLRVIGIDLGTTNSTITEAVWEPGQGSPQVEVIEVPQQTADGREIVQDVVPSTVAITDNGPLVGEGARRVRSSSGYRRNVHTFWDTKNEIGTSREYYRAPEGFKSPKDIASHILRFLRTTAEENAPGELDRVVITVPASFEWEQRQDTQEAATMAGLEVLPGDLLDEPTAALLDFLVTNGVESLPDNSEQAIMLVLDFGGGTCDVAILRLSFADDGGIELSREAVSRFHQIGGSHIDNQIAHEFLLPRLLEQHGKSQHAYSYTNKRDYLLPALATIAESLKIKMSDNLTRLEGLHRAPDPDTTVTLPGQHMIPTGKRDETLEFDTPSLSLSEFNSAVKRYVSPTLLAPKITEFTMVMSVFAPVQDALDRSGLSRDEIDAVLIVGGSSLLPPFRDAVDRYFPDATLLKFKEPKDALRCVGRGAAHHALLMAAYGNSPLKPTTGDSLSLRVRDGLVELIPRNAPLPYPDDTDAHFRELDGLSLPSGDGVAPTSLQLELVSGADPDDLLGATERTLHSSVESVAGPAKKGDPITVQVSVDENQTLDLRVIIKTDAGDQHVELRLDNPFSVVENPGKDRERLLQLEEKLRSLPLKRRSSSMFLELAELHKKLGSPEQAREIYERSLNDLSDTQRRDVYNRLGMLCGELHDIDAQIDYYREAASIGGGSAPLFNLAIALKSEKDRLPEALQAIDDALVLDSRPPDRILRADILRRLGRDEEADSESQAALEDATKEGLTDQSDWALGWLRAGASGLDRTEIVAEIDGIRKSRVKKADAPTTEQDFLPVRED